jgi:membrane protease YdiL (CAAX protease family)
MTAKQNIVLTSFLLLIVLGPCFGPVPRYLISATDVGPAAGWQIVAFYVALAVVFGWTLSWMRRNGRSLGDLGWRKPSTRLAVILGAVIGVVWGLLGAMGYLRFDPQANLFEMSSLRVFTALAGAFGAVFEDMVTRGFIMEELKRLGVSTWKQALYSSFLFALYHSIWWGSVPGFIGSFIASLIYGLILAGLFVLGKRSLTPVLLGHSLALIVGEPFLTLSMLMAMKTM